MNSNLGYPAKDLFTQNNRSINLDTNISSKRIKIKQNFIRQNTEI